MSPSELDRFGTIQVRGARENNLKNISLDIPRRQITVFTGVSGSENGKTPRHTVKDETCRRLRLHFTSREAKETLQAE